MPAMMDDPSSPTIYRVTGEAPFPIPNSPLPANILPRQVTLRDRQTVATVVPFASKEQVPPSLLLYLSDQFAKEVDKGDTYPMVDPMPFDKFAPYWFQNFGAIMLLGSIEGPGDLVDGKDWAKECLGSFYIKPNYPGRSSHVCNAGFLVTDASRNRGVGRLMGEAYLDWAPKLGYKYSVFNLVYETNVASCRIWDALGFRRIGRVPGCGDLRSHPGRLVDAIIYGRDLSPAAEDADELVSEDRFEKIKFYLKHGKYPDGADRAEKSRLRSAATHYKLLPDGDVLMLKDKEVISDPARQYDIARRVHAAQQHAGINKTTATIAERYHWRGIKDTVSDVIRACAGCEDGAKAGSGLLKPSTANQTSSHPAVPPAASPSTPVVPTVANDIQNHHPSRQPPAAASYAVRDVQSLTPTETPASFSFYSNVSQLNAISPSSNEPSIPLPIDESHTYQPIDPQIMSQPPPAPFSHGGPAVSYQHPNGNPSYHETLPEADIEASALQQLLHASSHDHHGGVGDITDHDLDLMLAQQQDAEIRGETARMEVDDPGDGVHSVALDHLQT